VTEVLFGNKKDEIIKKIKHIPLSASAVQNRTSKMPEDIKAARKRYYSSSGDILITGRV